MAEKEIKPVDPEDVSENIQDIVALLGAIESSRESINKRVKHLKDTYGLSATAVRAAATVPLRTPAERPLARAFPV